MSEGEIPGSGQDMTVVPEQVRDVGRYVYGLADTLRRALDSAATEVDSLTNGTWSGDAAAEFAGSWADLRDGGIRIIDALTGMAEKLGVTADSYETTDDDNATGFSSLRL